MTFVEWLEKEGRGAMTKVHRDTHVSYPTLTKAKRGEPLSRPLAMAISAATRGEVAVDTLEKGTASTEDDPLPATGTEG